MKNITKTKLKIKYKVIIGLLLKKVCMRNNDYFLYVLLNID